MAKAQGIDLQQKGRVMANPPSVNGNGNADHWLVRGMGGVNILTLAALLLGGASLYWQLDKDIALMKRDIADIEKQLTRIELQLTGAKAAPYAWPRLQGDQEKS